MKVMLPEFVAQDLSATATRSYTTRPAAGGVVADVLAGFATVA